MANPTTYFGWVMPNSADLVTDLPADFNVFGQGVDTSMSQLLGGTTGQVLSKTSGTNMAFTWVTPTDQTPLTTKGDLFTFTTVDARLGIGTNNQVLTADSAQATGMKWATPSAAGFNGALARNTSSQSIPNATWTAVVMDSEIFDSSTYWDTGANTRFTIPTTGKYSISAQALSTSTGSSCYVAVYKNGSANFQLNTTNNPNGQTVGGTTITSLTAADYIQLYVFQNQGSAATYYGNTGDTGAMQWSITFLGA